MKIEPKQRNLVPRSNNESARRKAARLSLTVAVGVAVLLTVAVPVAYAQPDRSHLAPFSEDELKQAYLECDLLASTDFLDSETAATCSMVAQELLERSFEGDFSQLLEWWRQAPKLNPELVRPVKPETGTARIRL